MVLGIPTTVDSIMVSNALTLKLLELPMIFREEIFLGISLGWTTLLVGVIFSMMFFYFSQRFLNFYIKLVELTHTKLLVVYFGIVAFLIYFDVTTSAVNIPTYFLMLSILTIFGFWLKKKEINPLPFLLGLLLGDSILWTYYHVATIYL
jgi:TctA family transporter